MSCQEKNSLPRSSNYCCVVSPLTCVIANKQARISNHGTPVRRYQYCVPYGLSRVVVAKCAVLVYHAKGRPQRLIPVHSCCGDARMGFVAVIVGIGYCVAKNRVGSNSPRLIASSFIWRMNFTTVKISLRLTRSCSQHCSIISTNLPSMKLRVRNRGSTYGRSPCIIRSCITKSKLKATRGGHFGVRVCVEQTRRTVVSASASRCLPELVSHVV